MILDKKELLLSAIKDQDDFYAKNQAKILSSLRGVGKLLSEKDRVHLYAKLFEKEGLKKSFFEEDFSILQKAYLRSLRFMAPKHALLFLFVFGFDKKEDLPTGKTTDTESLKDYYGILERFMNKADTKDVFKRKLHLAEIAKKNSVPLRALDCFRHLGFVDTPSNKPLKGAIDPAVFLALLYIVLLNKKTRTFLEKQMKNNTFHFPGKTEISDALNALYKEAGVSVTPAP